MGRSYTTALETFSAPDAERIDKTIRKWSQSDGLGRRIVRNLRELEFFLPTTNTVALLQSILDCHGKTLGDLGREYENACYKNIRQGGAIGEPQPTFVGRAVDKNRFVETLWQTHGTIGGTGYFVSRREVEDFVSRLLSGDTLTPTEDKLTMSKYSAWVTWNDLDSALDPFSFADSAELVRACLGLGSFVDQKDEPILLFVYEKRLALILHKPTVADAALSICFEPPPPGSKYGLTVPWLRESAPGLCPRPLPEAVHAPSTFDLLTGTPRQMI